jgi:acyl carrier protein
MTSDEITTVVVDVLKRIAPETDLASLQAGVSFRDQLDLDSMDFLNFVVALHERLGIDIPEVDYPRLASLDSAVAYLGSKGITTVREAEGSRARQRGDAR